MADTTFHGYDIKKGTMIIANLFSVHRDPESWGDPENFRPERFLSPDGKTVIRNESSMSFSVGKRQCPGRNINNI
jgi:cytochrome P450